MCTVHVWLKEDRLQSSHKNVRNSGHCDLDQGDELKWIRMTNGERGDYFDRYGPNYPF